MMKRFNVKTVLSLIGCIVLIAAMALITTGCGKETAPPQAASEVTFTVIVTDLEGAETEFSLTSSKATVGEALLEESLIEGDQGEYGMYIKSVNGIPLEWDKDQKYWAFYVDGEYALTGVDETELTAGAVYSFKPEG